MQENINIKPHKIIILMIYLPNPKKIARFEQTRIKDRSGNIKSSIKTKVIFILFTYFFFLHLKKNHERYMQSI